MMTGRVCFHNGELGGQMAMAPPLVPALCGNRLLLANQMGTRSPHVLCQAPVLEAGMHDALIRKAAVCYHLIESDASERGRR
jgi:hypothetical protein